MKIEFSDAMIEEIRERARSSGYKTRFLADSVGVHPSTFSRFMNKGSRLGTSALILLIQTLKIDVEDLVTKAS